MRLLLDNNLSVRLVPLLSDHGHDVEHVRTLGLAAADDAEVLIAAADAQRVLISADTDFGTLLAFTRAEEPSVVLLRRSTGRSTAELAEVLAGNLPLVADDLNVGAVVVMTDSEMRVRHLPIR